MHILCIHFSEWNALLHGLSEDTQRKVKNKFTVTELLNEKFLPVEMALRLVHMEQVLSKEECHSAAIVIEENAKRMKESSRGQEEEEEVDDPESPVVSAQGLYFTWV
jgi:hypothetical protein